MARLAPVLRRALPLLLLGGCSPSESPDQARLCRIATVVLAPAGSAIAVSRQITLPPEQGQLGVQVEFTTTAPGEPARRRFAVCRFAAPGSQPTGLVALRTDAGVVSETNLYFLNRFWLQTAEGDRADPQPVETWGDAPVLPERMAYALQIILNGLSSMASYGLLAAAYSLIYGLIGRINLAFGQMAAIGGAGSLTGLALLQSPGAAVFVGFAMMAALWTAMIHGIAIGRWIFVPLRRSTGQQGLVATVGLALVLDEYLRLIQGPTPLWITPLRSAPIALARSNTFPVTLTAIGIAVVVLSAIVAIAVLATMAWTQFGRNWRAMADDARAAALMGVSPTRMFAQSFALASALAGVSGATVVLVYGSFGTSYGAILGLKALLAAVLGGIGSVPGAFVGGIALGALEAGWSAFFPIEYRDLVVFAVLAAALVVRPGGFLGYGDGSPRRV